MHYPIDLHLNDDLDIHLDGGNDLATVSDRRQLEQSTALDVLNALREFVGNPVTGRTIGLLEERVRQALNADEQLSTVTNVSVEEYQPDSGRVTLAVSVVEDDDFELDLTV
jgi:hypothetical protein